MEELLGSGLDFPDVVEVAIRKLLNVVEALGSDKQELRAEFTKRFTTSTPYEALAKRIAINGYFLSNRHPKCT